MGNLSCFFKAVSSSNLKYSQFMNFYFMIPQEFIRKLIARGVSLSFTHISQNWFKPQL